MLSEEQIIEIKLLRVDGASTRELEQTLSMPESTVFRVLNACSRCVLNTQKWGEGTLSCVLQSTCGCPVQRLARKIISGECLRRHETHQKKFGPELVWETALLEHEEPLIIEID